MNTGATGIQVRGKKCFDFVELPDAFRLSRGRGKFGPACSKWRTTVTRITVLQVYDEYLLYRVSWLCNMYSISKSSPKLPVARHRTNTPDSRWYKYCSSTICKIHRTTIYNMYRTWFIKVKVGSYSSNVSSVPRWEVTPSADFERRTRESNKTSTGRYQWSVLQQIAQCGESMAAV